MLLVLFLLFSLSSAKISIHQTKETADLESTIRRREEPNFVENSKKYAVFDNWKTGEQENRVSSIVGPDSATDYYPGFISFPVLRVYDGVWFSDVSMCAASDLRSPEDDLPKTFFDERIEIGKWKTFENGTVKVTCARSDKGVSRVSEAVSGCYFNETVYPIHEQWTEPNPKGNERLKKLMRCEISEEGYFVSRLIGCSVNAPGEMYDWRTTLNSTMILSDETSKTCVETEPGVVQLLEGVENDYKSGCLVDNVLRKQWEMWQDDTKGGQFQCFFYGEVSKQYCTPSKNQHLPIDKEVKLKNGCTFLCHPQTNIFKCDKPMEMFKIVGKPRKMRQHKDFMFARRIF